MQITHGRFRVLSLALSRSTPQSISLIISVLLIEISQTFSRSIGEVSQMIALSSVLGIVTSMTLTLLAAKLSPTHLHNFGLALCTLSAIGSVFAPTYNLFFILYGVSIVGLSIVLPMTTTLTGELFRGEDRSRSLGSIFAGQAVFYILGYLIVGFISQWRLAYAYYATPLLALSFLVAYKVIPFIEAHGERESMSMGIQSILGSKSAVSCFLATAISGVWSVALALGATYYRQAHGVPLSTVTVLLVGFSLIHAVGSLAGGRFVYRIGLRKANAVLGVLMGASFIFLMITGSTVIAFALGFMLSFLSGVNMPAGSGLWLALIPEYKGSMMSLHSAAVGVSNTLSLGLMGYLLNLYGWAAGGLAVGALSVIGGVIIQLFVAEYTE